MYFKNLLLVLLLATAGCSKRTFITEDGQKLHCRIAKMQPCGMELAQCDEITGALRCLQNVREVQS